jgi:hypothetical protein
MKDTPARNALQRKACGDHIVGLSFLAFFDANENNTN